MKRMILPIVLALLLMPFALGSYRFANTPSSTASPAVAMNQPTSMSYRAPPLYVPQPMGVSRDVRFLPPVSEEQLQLDENGVVVDQATNPVTYGTSGGIFDTGHNSWTLKQRQQIGPYFSDNQVGFRAGPIQTNHFQKWRVRSYLTDFLGYHAPIQVLKQWSIGSSGKAMSGKYLNPGIPNMVKMDPQYVNPGLPAYVNEGTVAQ